MRFPKRGAIEKNKRDTSLGDLQTYLREIIYHSGKDEKSESESESKETPDRTEAITFLFRFLEYSNRFLTNANLKPDDISGSEKALTDRLDELDTIDATFLLSDPNNLPSLPVDVSSWDSKKKNGGSKKFIKNDACIPLWNGGILEENWGQVLSFSRNDWENVHDDNPFSGCHPDFLECIFLYPVTHVQTLSDGTMKEPITQEDVDMADLTGNLQHHDNIPVDQRSFPSHDICYQDDRLKNMMAKLHKTLENREGWNGNSPTLQHVFREIKK